MGDSKCNRVFALMERDVSIAGRKVKSQWEIKQAEWKTGCTRFSSNFDPAKDCCSPGAKASPPLESVLPLSLRYPKLSTFGGTFRADSGHQWRPRQYRIEASVWFPFLTTYIALMFSPPIKGFIQNTTYDRCEYTFHCSLRN